MDEEYDVIVLGTGLKECILSGLLSVDGKKVLHMDRNDYYGGASASLTLKQLYERFRGGQKPPDSLGSARDYNVDIVPKFMMADGALVRTLVHTDVTKYLQFKAVDGSYVLRQGKIHKVPSNDKEALMSPLMWLLEKRRARLFFIYVQNFTLEDPRTHEGKDLKSMTMKELFEFFHLQPDTQEFIGHALALHTDDEYLLKPALPTVMKIKLYEDSLLRFENMKAPYIYPLYGLGELPQAFARLSAVYGGVYMLAKPGCITHFGEDGKVCGVESDGEIAKTKAVVADASYFGDDKSQTTFKVVRAICIMSHPIPNTADAASVQIILPQKQIGRKNDMYVFCSSYHHNVAPRGKYIAFVSTNVETANPESELTPGLALLGPIDEKFVDVVEYKTPLSDGTEDNCFISQGYDATTHFETVMADVMDLYQRITGKPLDLSEKDLSSVQEGDENY